jgi:hypothetical protein
MRYHMVRNTVINRASELYKIFQKEVQKKQESNVEDVEMKSEANNFYGFRFEGIVPSISDFSSFCWGSGGKERPKCPL